MHIVPIRFTVTTHHVTDRNATSPITMALSFRSGLLEKCSHMAANTITPWHLQLAAQAISSAEWDVIVNRLYRKFKSDNGLVVNDLCTKEYMRQEGKNTRGFMEMLVRYEMDRADFVNRLGWFLHVTRLHQNTYSDLLTYEQLDLVSVFLMTVWNYTSATRSKKLMEMISVKKKRNIDERVISIQAGPDMKDLRGVRSYHVRALAIKRLSLCLFFTPRYKVHHGKVNDMEMREDLPRFSIANRERKSYLLLRY